MATTTTTQKRRPPTKRAHVHIYNAKDGLRWRAVAANKRVLADSGEAYSSLPKLLHGLKRLRELMVNAPEWDHFIDDDVLAKKTKVKKR